MKNHFRYLVLSLLLMVAGLCFAAEEASSGSKPQTHVLQRVDIPGTAYQEGLGMTDFLPNAIKNQQMQTGPEVCYVLEGEITYVAKGQAPRIIKAGESYQIPTGEIHYSKAGPKGAKILATWVLEKDKPFAIPVPKQN